MSYGEWYRTRILGMPASEPEHTFSVALAQDYGDKRVALGNHYARIRCSGELHMISWAQRGRITLHNHTRMNRQAWNTLKELGANTTCACQQFVASIKQGVAVVERTKVPVKMRKSLDAYRALRKRRRDRKRYREAIKQDATRRLTARREVVALQARERFEEDARALCGQIGHDVGWAKPMHVGDVVAETFLMETRFGAHSCWGQMRVAIAWLLLRSRNQHTAFDVDGTRVLVCARHDDGTALVVRTQRYANSVGNVSQLTTVLVNVYDDAHGTHVM